MPRIGNSHKVKRKYKWATGVTPVLPREIKTPIAMLRFNDRRRDGCIDEEDICTSLLETGLNAYLGQGTAVMAEFRTVYNEMAGTYNFFSRLIRFERVYVRLNQAQYERICRVLAIKSKKEASIAIGALVSLGFAICDDDEEIVARYVPEGVSL